MKEQLNQEDVLTTLFESTGWHIKPTFSVGVSYMKLSKICDNGVESTVIIRSDIDQQDILRKVQIFNIKESISMLGGVGVFSDRVRRNRAVGCPKQFTAVSRFKDLTPHEYHIAWKLGLIGDNAQVGIIVKNGTLS